MVAPAEPGLSSWSVRFAAEDLALPHDGSSAAFSLATVRPPEHTLTVKVIEKDTARPVEDTVVRLGAFRATTDAAGLAEIRASQGCYDLAIWKTGYEAPPRPVDIQGDLTMQVEVAIVPEEDPDAPWKM